MRFRRFYLYRAPPLRIRPVRWRLKSARRPFPVNAGNCLRDIPIFTRQELQRCFKDSDFRTEVGEH